MNVTLKQVAELAGVSRSAVSRSFTEGASVSEKTRRKVEAAAESLGYSPNILARSLTTRSTRMIGLVSNNFRNPVFLQIFDLFTRALQDRGLRPLLVNLTDESDPARSVQLLRQYSVDGVIVASSTLPLGFAKAFRDIGRPVVHAFGRATDKPVVDVVGIDNVAAGRLAARELIRRGYRLIGFMGGPQFATTTQDRLAGFVEETALHPHIIARASFAGSYTFEAGRVEMARLLREDTSEAYFCADDVLSVGALAAASEVGLEVPADLGLIGLNDMEMASWTNINLTTIRQPFDEIIEASINLITTKLENPDRQPESRVFHCSIVERGTLRPAR